MDVLTEVRVGAKALYRYFVKGTKVYAYVNGGEFRVIPAVAYDAISGMDLCNYIRSKGENFKNAYLNWLFYYRGSSSFEGDMILDRDTVITVCGSAMTPSQETCLISYLTGRVFDLIDIDQMDVSEVDSMCGVVGDVSSVEIAECYSGDGISEEERHFSSVCSAVSRSAFECLNAVGYGGKTMSYVLQERADDSKINIIYNPDNPESYYNYKRIVLYFDINTVPSISKVCSSYVTQYFVVYYWGLDMDYRLLPPRVQKYMDVWTDFFSPHHVYHVMDERGKSLLMKHAYWGSCPVVSSDSPYDFLKKDVPRKDQVCFLTDVFRKGHSLYMWVDIGKVLPYKVVNLSSNLVVPVGTIVRLGKFSYVGELSLKCVDTGQMFIKALYSASFPVAIGDFVQQVNLRVVRASEYNRVSFLLKKNPGSNIRPFQVFKG